MTWNLSFISEEDFKNHVRATIMKYGEKLESYDLKRLETEWNGSWVAEMMGCLNEFMSMRKKL